MHITKTLSKVPEIFWIYPRIDTLHRRRRTAASVIRFTLINVDAVEPIPAVARRTRTTNERARQIDAAHFRVLRAVWLRFATLIHIHRTGRRQPVRLPALITDTAVAILRLHARTMTTQIGPSCGTVLRPGVTVNATPPVRAHAGVATVYVLTRRPILAAQIGARKQCTLVHVRRARLALPVARTQAHERVVLSDTGASVLTGPTGTAVYLQRGHQESHLRFHIADAPSKRTDTGIHLCYIS